MGKTKILAVAFCSLFIVGSCAKRGTITGGDKDITPPKITSSSPKNLSTNFDKKTIRINFDEYIKVKDLQKNLIVSPPMKIPPTVLPQGGASKYLTIKINDSLKANTTYSLNFGQSIVDNNEGNAYPQLKYVFSTGALIDSLTVEGIVKDSYEKETEPFVNVMLYEVDEKYNDSIIYKQTPRYVINTLDSLKTFKIENVKAGQYKLVALKEKNNNYKFDPDKDKIGFYNQIITVPDKSIFELELFKEEPAFKIKKPTQVSGNRIIVGYVGNAKNTKIDVKHQGEALKTKLTKLADKDSLQVWFKGIKNDSLQLFTENKSYKKDFMIKIRNQKQDTLKLTTKQKSDINPKENFIINSSIPLEKFDVTKMALIKKDSSKVDFKTNYDEFNQNLEILFPKEPEEKYTFSMLPNAVEDYLGQKNDSLTFKFSTKNLADYANLKLTLDHVNRFPIIVELLDSKAKVVAFQYSEKETVFNFDALEPDKYVVRVIYDDNKDGQRTTGSYLEKRQAEEVIYLATEISLHANFDWDQQFDLAK